METIDSGKTRLNRYEAEYLIEGLEALARENTRMAEDAHRLGYAPQAAEFRAKAREAGGLAQRARNAGITRITVRHS